MTALLMFLSLLAFTPDVTKEEVKKLVAAGVSDDAIVAYIRSHGPVGALSAEDLIDLRHANVSDRVLAAMVEASSAPPTTSPEPPGYPYRETTPYAWFYTYGYFPYYYYGPSFWWYLGPDSSLYRHWPYSSRYPYSYRYYHYPRYPYGYHWAPTWSYPPRHEVSPHPKPCRPAAVPHSTPKGGGKH
jgi:hypothetical protein